MIARPVTVARYVRTCLLWAGVWAAAVVAAVLLGSQNIWAWADPAARGEVLRMRLYVVATASAVGAALALAGLGFQALLRNPLASPYILGISGGAGLGVLLASLFLSVTLAPLFGFAGALATVLLVWAVAQRRGRLEPYTLLLSGVIVNAFYAAGIMGVTALVSPERRGDIAYWMMGTLSPFDLDWARPAVAAALAVGAAALFAAYAKAFNLVAVGEETAGALGVRVHRLRLVTFVAASLLTGAAVAVAGPIGFVGLIVPHLLRLALGPDHRLLVPATLFAGAALLVVADLATRLLQGVGAGVAPPVGVLTALAGGPFFIFLLRTRWRKAAELR